MITPLSFRRKYLQEPRGGNCRVVEVGLSKLDRNTQRDRDDVRHLARTVPFEIAVLQERYQKELRPSLGNPEREDLTLRLWIEAIEEERGTRLPTLLSIPFIRSPRVP